MSTLLEGDIKFFYGTSGAEADILPIQGTAELERDPGLETAVIISLFTDQRAAESDKLPDTLTTRRGYWGDALSNSNIGSKYWLLERSKINGETLALLKQYTVEALEWMIEDGIADRIEANAEKNGQNRVLISGSVVRKDNANIFFEYFLNWKYQITGAI